MSLEQYNCAYKEIVPLHKLRPHPQNTNQHPRKQIELLAKVIQYNGQRRPITVSTRTGLITKGHGLLMALQELSWTNGAVDYQDYESDEHELADMHADNRIALLSKNDEEKFLAQVQLLPLGFDIEMFGIGDFKKLLPISEPELKKIKEEKYMILVECQDELEMHDLYDEFQKREIKCKFMN